MDRVILYLGIMLIGASTWISLERFNVVPAMCVVTQDVYQQRK